MKKYMFILFVFTLFVTLLGFNVGSASADYPPGCNESEQGNSTTTGQPCNVYFAAGCTSADPSLYGIVGVKCSILFYPEIGDYSDSVVVFSALFKSNFKLGAKGDDVKALQRFLKAEEYSIGKIDGQYGKRTVRAVKDFMDDNDLEFGNTTTSVFPPGCNSNSGFSSTTGNPCGVSSNDPVISGVSGPQSLNVNQQGTWTVTASSKNNRGALSYQVSWGDENTNLYGRGVPESTFTARQSATFSHVYTSAGIYKPIFTVTSQNTINCVTTPCPGNGGSATTSLSVTVGNISTTFPPGCISDQGFSSTTGEPCGTAIIPVTTSIDSQNPGAGLVLASGASLSYRYLPDVKEDHAGGYHQFNGNGENDWVFEAALTLNSSKTIKAILETTNYRGSAAYTRQDPVDGGGMYPIVVFLNGNQLNTAYDQTLGTYGPGTYPFRLFTYKEASSSTVFSTFGVTIYFTDGTYITKTIPGSSVIQQNPSITVVKSDISVPSQLFAGQILGVFDVNVAGSPATIHSFDFNVYPNSVVSSLTNVNIYNMSMGNVVAGPVNGQNIAGRYPLVFNNNGGDLGLNIPVGKSTYVIVGNTGSITNGQQITLSLTGLSFDTGHSNSIQFPVVLNTMTIENSPTPSITVLSPNGGEQWVAGSQHSVSYSTNYDGQSTFEIGLLSSGNVYTQIAASANYTFGNILWTIPASIQAGSYQIVIYVGTRNSHIAKDLSDAPFTITTSTTPSLVLNSVNWMTIASVLPISANSTANPNSSIYYNPRVNFGSGDLVPFNDTASATKWCRAVPSRSYTSGISTLAGEQVKGDRYRFDGTTWLKVTNADYPRYYTCSPTFNAVQSSIVVSKDSSSPVSGIVYDNQTVNTLAAKFTATASDYRVTDVALTLGANANTVVNNVMLYDGATLLGSAPAFGTSVTFSGLNWNIPANTSKVLTVKLALGPIGVGSGTTNSSLVTTLTSFTAIDVLNGISALGTGTAVGNNINAFASTPTILKAPNTSESLTNGTNTPLLRFIIAGNGGEISWDQLTFKVSKASAVKVGTNATTGFSIMDEMAKIIVVGTFSSDAAVYGSGAGGDIKFIPATEQVVSGSRTYELRANTGSVTTAGDYVTTTLDNDSKVIVPSSTVSFISNGDSDAPIIWSDNSAVSHAVSTADWTTDFGIKSLPVSNTIVSQNGIGSNFNLSSLLTANVIGATNDIPKNENVSVVEKFHFTQFLEQGSYGNEVREFQKFLNGAGYNAGNVDGVFGSKVKDALIKFQIANKLKADGIVGYQIRTFLNK